MLPFALCKKQLAPIQFRRDAWNLLGLLFSTALIAAPLFYAVKIIGVGLSTTIAYAGIVIGAFFFGFVIGGEKYTKDKWVSTILGIAGLFFVFSPSTKSFGFLALIAALVSGLATGLNMVINKRIRYSATQSTILTWGATIISNVPLVLILNETMPKVRSDVHWLYLLGFATVSVLSSFTLISGLKLIEAGAAGILGLLEIVFGVIFGMLLFNEKLTLLIFIGIILITSAAAIPYFQHYNSKSGTLK